MKCPVDNETLVMTERQGVEIDYCPKCRGVWLDRGELDKIIEKTETQQSPAPAPRREHSEREREDYRPNARTEYKPHRKKRESILGEIFDIF